MSRILRTIVVLVGIVCIPSLALAQSSSIAGLVSDASGAVLPGVTVEASSPALIEGSRVVTTDGSGRYTISELRPGTYTVTFTLAGFTTIKREGIELTAAFAANIPAQLKVGSLEESVTVSGATPVVDIQNVVKQRLVTADVLEAVPSGKSWSQVGVLTVGVSSSLTDVGGSAGENQNPMSAHGGSTTDKVIEMDGLRLGLLTGGSAYASTGISANDASTQELSFEIGANSASSGGGGVIVNIVPKEGGNRFAASLFGNFSTNALTSNNFYASDGVTPLPKFKATGALAPDAIKQIYDSSATLGGPIAQNKLWFFTAQRWWGFQNYKTSAFYEANPIDYKLDFAASPIGSGLAPTPDQRAYDDQKLQSHNLRLTWQANSKNKLGFYYDYQPRCTCHWQVSSTRTGEASFVQNLPLNFQATVTHSWTISNKLLFTAGAGNLSARWTTLPQTDRVPVDPATGKLVSLGFGVNDSGTGISYRADGAPFNTNFSATRSFRAALAYVTGSHNIRLGFNLVNGPIDIPTWMTDGDVRLNFSNGIPNSITRYATPSDSKDELNADLGVFLTDTWTIKRLTANVGIRFDYLNESVLPQHFDAGTWVPARDYPGQSNVPDWKDIDPRFGLVYDVFGKGKTALKASLSRYVAVEATGTAQANNPINTFRASSTQTWVDPACNATTGCAGWDGTVPSLATIVTQLTGSQSPGVVGSPVVSSVTDPTLLSGWGKRRFNWETSFGVQQQLMPRVSADVSYYRRKQGNFTGTDNLNASPSDYTPFCVTVPADATDSRLPTPGSQICGLYDLTPDRAGERLEQLRVVQCRFERAAGSVAGRRCGDERAACRRDNPVGRAEHGTNAFLELRCNGQPGPALLRLHDKVPHADQVHRPPHVQMGHSDERRVPEQPGLPDSRDVGGHQRRRQSLSRPESERLELQREPDSTRHGVQRTCEPARLAAGENLQARPPASAAGTVRHVQRPQCQSDRHAEQHVQLERGSQSVAEARVDSHRAHVQVRSVVRLLGCCRPLIRERAGTAPALSFCVTSGPWSLPRAGRWRRWQHWPASWPLA